MTNFGSFPLALVEFLYELADCFYQQRLAEEPYEEHRDIVDLVYECEYLIDELLLRA